MMPDGGDRCDDTRWYCRDARARSQQWTASRRVLSWPGYGTCPHERDLVSTWQVQALIERLWAKIYRAERWPSLVKQVKVAGDEELEPGVADGVGRRLRPLTVS